MASNTAPLPTGAPTAGGDEFDDMFDYEIDGENDPFSESYKVPGSKDAPNPSSTSRNSGEAGLGIDEEIEVTRKPRVPRVKLDEHRLLSANGIPKLRKKAKSELRLKGKGHEYSDAARLLAFYQLWLDDLFPKARFLDALAMVEKMGHKKMLQMARMEWINEGRPKPDGDDDIPPPTTESMAHGDDGRSRSDTRIAPIFEKRASERSKTPAGDDLDAIMDDLYDATPQRARPETQAGAIDSQDSLFGGPSQSIFGPKAAKPLGEELDEDDLDALLAEEDALQSAAKIRQTAPTTSKRAPAQDSFDDEMEAMAEMDGMW